MNPRDYETYQKFLEAFLKEKEFEKHYGLQQSSIRHPLNMNPCAEIPLPQFNPRFPERKENNNLDEYINVGRKVRSNPDHTDHERYIDQHENQTGIVTSMEPPNYAVVQWDNKQIGIYLVDMLLPLNDDGTDFIPALKPHIKKKVTPKSKPEEVPFDPIDDWGIYEPTPTQKSKDLEVGAEVIINPANKAYEQFYSQHRGNVGVITDGTKNDHWLRIRWSHGHEDGYPRESIIRTDDTEAMEKATQARIRREEYRKKFNPFLIGTRVCLNPEMSGYEDYKQNVEGTSGYVVKWDISEGAIITLKDMSINDLNCRRLTVWFDNGRKHTIRHDWLLKEDAPSVTVEHIGLNDQTTEICIDGTINPRLDDQIFRRGYRIVDRKIYDDEWRNIMQTRIAKK